MINGVDIFEIGAKILTSSGVVAMVALYIHTLKSHKEERKTFQEAYVLMHQEDIEEKKETNERTREITIAITKLTTIIDERIGKK